MSARNDAQLKKMYKLFAKVGGLKVLNAAFKLYVQASATVMPIHNHPLNLIPFLERREEYRDGRREGRRDDPPPARLQGFH